MKPLFAYIGNKSRVADIVWARIGNPSLYVEPFCGSAAMLMARPCTEAPSRETIGDFNHYVTNYFRSIKGDPDKVADYFDFPISEIEIHARHYWLISEGANILQSNVGDPDFYDPKIAGFWAHGMKYAIQNRYCMGQDPWQWEEQHWQKGSPGICRNMPDIGRTKMDRDQVLDYMRALSVRLNSTRILYGDWKRTITEGTTNPFNNVGVFLDPPYAAEGVHDQLYASEDTSISKAVREWAIDHGEDPKFRIALAGYSGEHDMPDGWVEVSWKQSPGYSTRNQDTTKIGKNSARERIWFSRHCLSPEENPWGL